MTLRVAMGQINPTVGDIEGNVGRILDAWRRAADRGADLIVLTELAVTGYPPEDLLLKDEFVRANLDALDRLAEDGPGGCAAVVGFVGLGEEGEAEDWDETVSARELHNCATVILDGQPMATYVKWRLPNYGVFDEARYFQPAGDACVVDVRGVRIGLTICEDLWVPEGPAAAAADLGAQVIVSPNASPYHRGKRDQRERWVRHHATSNDVYVVYTNQVGGQDEVVFDGDSMVAGPSGDVLARAAQFAEDLVLVDLPLGPDDRERPPLAAHAPAARLGPVAEVWEALVLGTRDYCRKNGFGQVVLGLSGGIDSAVTGALAAHAIGGHNVHGVGMPSPYSSDHSIEDARQLAESFGMRWSLLRIDDAMIAVEAILADEFAETPSGVAEENIQARLRGLLLMAISNKFGRLALATGNKSEAGVGYATLYGDMAGGFSPLKDVPKTLVYELAEHVNAMRGPRIPKSSLTKPPSAELRHGQIDEDSLPPYEVLDPILAAYVEEDLSVAAIIERGFDEEVVRDVIRQVDRAEFKRRQAAPGIKITERAFGKDRRVPITNGWRT
ncbi:MAG TPA: NAD+ synthase [Nitriliruptorales bacterium]